RPRGNALVDLGFLTNRRAHAALAHAVRTAEVELDTICPRVNGALDDVAPLLLGFDHERNNEGVLRVLLFDVDDLAKVRLERTVGDELDVVEAGGFDTSHRVPAEATGDVLDGLPKRLPDRAAPTVVEGPLDLIARVRRRCRGEPERVRRDDATGVARQVNH